MDQPPSWATYRDLHWRLDTNRHDINVSWHGDTIARELYPLAVGSRVIPRVIGFASWSDLSYRVSLL